jgi:Circularly permutated YpsA SLOG family
MLTIVSGGQTGVDRAALDVAIELGIPYRGWCPKGGWAEDMSNPSGVLTLYPELRETQDADPRQRTEWNVRDCDRLMVLIDRAGLPVSKGTAFAVECAGALAKPHIVIDIGASDAEDLATGFLSQGQGPLAVCIAGPREGEAPGIYASTKGFLGRLLVNVADSR